MHAFPYPQPKWTVDCRRSLYGKPGSPGEHLTEVPVTLRADDVDVATARALFRMDWLAPGSWEAVAIRRAD